MITWDNFVVFFFLTAGFWSLGLVFSAFTGSKLLDRLSVSAFLVGEAVLICFLVLFWISLERPPLRTLGETRLWYSVLLPLTGLVVRWRWDFKWLVHYTIVLASVFLFINYLHPELHDKTLMPALQSVWFIPHVVVYLVGYALLGGAAMVSVHGLYVVLAKKSGDKQLSIANSLVTLGFVFLSMGLLFGGLWAKEAWGHYWTWDPKETWAFLTWIAFLIYIHLNVGRRMTKRFAFTFLALSFVVLLLCWFGVNYMPSSQSSVHTYN